MSVAPCEIEPTNAGPPPPWTAMPPGPPCRRPVIAAGAVEIVGEMMLISADADEPEREARGTADESLHHRLARDLADDAAVRPADRLERAELAGAARDARDREQDGEQRRATASTMIDSQVPRFVMSEDALESEPETVEARSDCELTVASGSSSWSAGLHARDRVGGLRLHVDGRDDVARRRRASCATSSGM